MSNAVLAVQAAAVAALQEHPALSVLTGIYDGPPPRAPFPYLSVGEGIITDWSTKSEAGREIRLALTVWDDGEEAARLHRLLADVEDAIAAMPRDLGDWQVASNVFLRSLIVRDAAGPWAGLAEFRLRVLATP